MIRTIRKFEYWEMPEAILHAIKINLDSEAGIYDVMIDTNFYCSSWSEDGAVEEIIRFLDNVWWCAVRPSTSAAYKEVRNG